MSVGWEIYLNSERFEAFISQTIYVDMIRIVSGLVLTLILMILNVAIIENVVNRNSKDMGMQRDYIENCTNSSPNEKIQQKYEMQWAHLNIIETQYTIEYRISHKQKITKFNAC